MVLMTAAHLGICLLMWASNSRAGPATTSTTEITHDLARAAIVEHGRRRMIQRSMTSFDVPTGATSRTTWWRRTPVTQARRWWQPPAAADCARSKRSQGAHPSGPDVARHEGGRCKHDLHVAADDILQRRPGFL
jgi:hypothetical protein